MKLFKRTTQRRSQRTGATAVEFSLTLPILLLFIFATFELGRGNMMMNTTEAAAYEAARVAIVPGATVAEAEAAAELILATAGIEVSDFSIVPGNLDTASESVAVTIDVSFAENSLFLPDFLESTRFVRTCELNRENQ